jgi:UDP-N-acetyl-D-mannosaminouronate:lipid I N-acetyl-D-mannosaminouronosyltransferase
MVDTEVLVGGVPVLVHSSMESAVESVFSQAGDEVVPGFAIAINPEKVMKAHEDSQLMHILWTATLRFADGIGVVLALRSKGFKQAIRVPGCEFWIALMQRAGQLKQPVFLIGAQSDVLDQVSQKLVSEFGVNVVGQQHGFFKEMEKDALVKRIRDSGAGIVTVAMGSPRQELFIYNCRQSYPNAFYMGVGGTYDVFVGNVKRAPVWACNLNLEWLYRLISNPVRVSRQSVLLKYLIYLLFRRL